MAIDPRITSGIRVPDAGNVIAKFNQNMQNNAEQKRIAELHPLRVQQAEQAIESNQQGIDQNRATQRIQNIHQTGQRLKPIIESGDIAAATKFMLDHVSSLQGRIEAGEKIDITESLETLQNLQAGNSQQVLQDINSVEGIINQQSGQGASAGQREFQNLINIAQDPNSTELEGNSAKRALGSMAKVGTSAQERIAQDKTLGQQVADQKSAESASTEKGKSTTQLKFKPQITRAVKLAEKEATERGDILTDLSRMTAALPGLKESVSELRELSQIATSTLGGRLYDLVIKESGFGGTKGATARDKFTAIVRNQVLPLLKQTFGSAFTEKEGEALMATMGDVDASHESRMGQLDAFITQKERSIRTTKAQVDQTVTPEVAINEFAGFKVVR